MGIHFVIAQLLGSIVLLYLMRLSGNGQQAYYDNAVLLTGITGICTMFPCIFFYRKDFLSRKMTGVVSGSGQPHLSPGEGIWLLFLGAALAQFGNILITFVMIFLDTSEYQETMTLLMEGKSLAMLILWMGIAAPIAEELVFRCLIYLRLRDYTTKFWAAVISGVIFGIYHGNFAQAVYAGLLGMAFAYILEMSGNLLSCILLHIGANVWSLLYTEIAERLNYNLLLAMMVVLLVVLITGFSYFTHKGEAREKRCV